MVALAPFDFQAHDTFFIVAHLHYVLIGGALFPILAGLLLFLSADQRQKALRAAREDRLLAHVHRLQRRLPADAPDRAARHAAAGLHLSGRPGLRQAEPRLDHRRLHPRRRALPSSSGTSSARRGSSRTRSAIRGVPARWSGCRDAAASHGACARFRRSTAAIRCGTSRTSCAMYDEGRFYLPDAEEGARDAGHLRHRRAAAPVPAAAGSTFIPHAAAITWAASSSSAPIICGRWRGISLVLALGVIWHWLWTGTAVIPEKRRRTSASA